MITTTMATPDSIMLSEAIGETSDAESDRFMRHFKLYLEYVDDPAAFVVDLQSSPVLNGTGEPCTGFTHIIHVHDSR
jgi:hypothetical protein